MLGIACLLTFFTVLFLTLQKPNVVAHRKFNESLFKSKGESQDKNRVIDFEHNHLFDGSLVLCLHPRATLILKLINNQQNDPHYLGQSSAAIKMKKTDSS